MTPNIFPGSEKYPLLQYPSALFKLTGESGRSANHSIYMFMDDPEDFALGGNKVRFYEYLLPEIIKATPDFLVTSGSPFSNHIRVTAEVCSKLGLGCRLLIESDALAEETPNIKTARSLGAEIIYIGEFAAMLKIKEYVDGLKAEGLKFYHVPNAGHSAPAVRAYAGVITEALMRADDFGLRFSQIWLPCASGTTQAGMLVGAEILKADGIIIPEIRSVAVGNTQKGSEKGVKSLIREASKAYDGIPAAEYNPIVTDCGKNEYGHPDEELLSLRKLVYEENGFYLDKTYNINAFYGMKKATEEETDVGNILYINTGGYTG